ncbi:hypothetical protein FEDK69T_29600 [Flavobacterium enshiense DK69]|uniref:Uncharacterized protein n=1 Tax=Flavobacterium enshiense DK69 TaxID=1107311 RepID=V6S7Q8_9FLAO|nr:hypothetical protein FEDK69T_29600 [Flavobacterium enshiense DK69]KGO95755.1 hypothetical protein Q767_08675 [Flavobacterium enshiense DK69]
MERSSEKSGLFLFGTVPAFRFKILIKKKVVPKHNKELPLVAFFIQELLIFFAQSTFRFNPG